MIPRFLLDEFYELVITGPVCSADRYECDHHGWSSCKQTYREALHSMDLEGHICIRYVVTVFKIRVIQWNITRWTDAMLEA